MNIKYYLGYISCLDATEYCNMGYIRNTKKEIIKFDSFELANSFIDEIKEENLEEGYDEVLYYTKDCNCYKINKDHIFIIVKLD